MRSPASPREPSTWLRVKPWNSVSRKCSTDSRRSILEYHPEVVAIEDVFYSVNAKSALKLGHVRGVAMMSAAQHGLSVVAYAPLAIKSAVVGYGRAEKSQVQVMVARLLHLDADSPARRCRRRPRHRHLPHSYGGYALAPGQCAGAALIRQQLPRSIASGAIARLAAA